MIRALRLLVELVAVTFTNHLYDEHSAISERSQFTNTPDSADSDYATVQNGLDSIGMSLGLGRMYLAIHNLTCTSLNNTLSIKLFLDCISR